MRSAVVAVIVLAAAAPAQAAPGDRYGGRAGNLAVGLTLTQDRSGFEAPGARDWQGSQLVARRSLPCVGRSSWALDGRASVHGRRFVIRRSSRGDKLRLAGGFGVLGASLRLQLRSGHCVFRKRLVVPITHRLKGSCRPAHSKTLAAGTLGRVFTQTDVDDLGGKQTNAYGCLFGERRRFFLHDDEPPDEYVAASATAGSLAATAGYSCPTDCGGAVTVTDLRDGERVRFDEVLPMCNQPDVEPPEISSLVLAPSGSYAYIARGFAQSGPRVNDVVKNVAGASTLLDCGTGIAPRSLTLNGTTLGWTNAGQARNAPLE